VEVRAASARAERLEQELELVRWVHRDWLLAWGGYSADDSAAEALYLYANAHLRKTSPAGKLAVPGHSLVMAVNMRQLHLCRQRRIICGL
jgi:hypothetical protein